MSDDTKQCLIVMIAIIFVVISIVAGFCWFKWIDRDDPHVYTADEIYAQECAKRGGDATTKSGSDDGLNVQEYKCEVKDVSD